MAVYQTGGRTSSAWTDAAQVGPMTEGAAGIAVIVLTILGLSAVSPAVLASIATIVIGVGLIIESANTGIEYSRVTDQAATAGAAQTAELGADVTVQVMAGVAGIVLGILALLSAGALLALLPAALVVFGGAMLLAGFSATTVSAVRGMESVTGERMVTMESELAPARGLQVMIGIASIVLGILAFVLTAGGTLLMVGLLVVGCGLLATSANFTQSFMKLLSR
ncbi:MAG TPA: hypothetical protein VJR70_02830 [Stellaceae bacterium]|nr:hypothetical protein [Stellaceae bacterium]